MDALTLLLNRRSAARLTSPAPQKNVLENILKAGMRAPDHGALQPWRFIIITEEGLTRFSDLLVKAAKQAQLDEQAIEKARQAPFRAPMIITVVAHCQPSPKVPQWEQIISAGCALQAMQMAALAQGFNGIWRSGMWTDDPLVRQAMFCREDDVIVGFLYLGTPLLKTIDVVSRADPSLITRYF